MNNNWLAVETLVKDRIDEALRDAERERLIRQVEAATGSRRVNATGALIALGGVVLLLIAG